MLSVHSGLGVGRLTAFRVGSAAHSEFLVTGDVYRRDTIDATHNPVFHQMEGVVKLYIVSW